MSSSSKLCRLNVDMKETLLKIHIKMIYQKVPIKDLAPSNEIVKR